MKINVAPRPRLLMLMLSLGIILLLLTSCATKQSEISAHNQRAQVIRIIDGDTFEVELRNKQRQRVRLSGVDAPEKKNAFGPEATAFATHQLLGKQVLLLNDSKGQRWSYSRRVMLVYLDGVDFNELLLSAGLARVAPRYPHERTPHYKVLEAQAKAKRLGIWSAP